MLWGESYVAVLKEGECLVTKNKPVNQQRKSPATQLPGQTGSSVPVQVSRGGTRKQEDLRGRLIRNRRRLDGGGVVVNFRLSERRWDLTTWFLKMFHLKHKIPIKINPSVQVRSYFPSRTHQETAASERERLALAGCDVVSLALTTSGDSMSCRKEWRLRVVRGFGMVVSWQRSEFREVLDELWSRQCKNHTPECSKDSPLWKIHKRSGIGRPVEEVAHNNSEGKIKLNIIKWNERTSQATTTWHTQRLGEKAESIWKGNKMNFHLQHSELGGKEFVKKI